MSISNQSVIDHLEYVKQLFKTIQRTESSIELLEYDKQPTAFLLELIEHLANKAIESKAAEGVLILAAIREVTLRLNMFSQNLFNALRNIGENIKGNPQHIKDCLEKMEGNMVKGLPIDNGVRPYPDINECLYTQEEIDEERDRSYEAGYFKAMETYSRKQKIELDLD